ncbi:MAG: leucine/isoleucine/valine transporter permease subunit [Anaerolineae bacterium]|nr:leucine/isoleucine/valine transporter permease subunit [Anaerolineae bacterium]
MEKHRKPYWRTALQVGLVAGVVLLYLGTIGMLAAFQEREVIYEIVSLGQILIVFPSLVGGWMAARRVQAHGASPVVAIASSVLAGIAAAVPTLIMLVINANVENVRDVLVNINRDWVDIVTFGNRDDLLAGAVLLLVVLAVASAVGALLTLLPGKLRSALIFTSALVLLVGMFGETVRQILQQLLPRETLDSIYRRTSLRVGPAVIIFVLGFIGSYFWAYRKETASRSAPRAANVTPRSLTQRIIVFIVLAIVLLALPLIVGRALSDILVTVGLYVLMGLGLNIAIGLAGLLDLGYVTNYAVGAYICAVLTSTGTLGLTGGQMSFWVVIPIALVAAMITGFLLAMPVLKMRGDYLAIATLGFGEILGTLAISDWLRPVIGGAQGVLFIPKPNFFGTELVNPEQLYYIVLAACAITLFISIRLNNSRVGRRWMAIREDEDVAAAMGIDTARAKLLAFTISAATGGVAGAIFAAKVGTVFPNSFTVFVSINVLSLIILGGMGSNPGIVVGAIALVGMPELLREFSEYRWLIYGALLIFMMLNRPEGLIPSKVRQRELAAESPPESTPNPTSAAQPAIGD